YHRSLPGFLGRFGGERWAGARRDARAGRRLRRRARCRPRAGRRVRAKSTAPTELGAAHSTWQAWRMPELPSATVTFLFSDIEGSTALLRQLRDRYGDVL